MPTEYPVPFGADDCPGGPPPTSGGGQTCVTLDQLLDDDPELSVVGGFGILGTPAHWRCPSITELMADSGCHLSEGCCVQDAYCGPLAQSGPAAASDSGGAATDGTSGVGGVAGASSGVRDDHECCYYVVRVCGV
jgi:hypothetical protein